MKNKEEIKARIVEVRERRLIIRGQIGGYIKGLEATLEGKTDNEIKKTLMIIKGDVVSREWGKYGIKIEGGVIGYTEALEWVLNKNDTENNNQG